MRAGRLAIHLRVEVQSWVWNPSRQVSRLAIQEGLLPLQPWGEFLLQKSQFLMLQPFSDWMRSIQISNLLYSKPTDYELTTLFYYISTKYLHSYTLTSIEQATGHTAEPLRHIKLTIADGQDWLHRLIGVNKRRS